MQEKIAKLKEIKILFVEDEVDLITIISDTLAKLGANFITASNGKEGLEKLAANPDVKLVVTDINMPIMNGIEMIRNIREQGSNIPCIIMSAHTEPEYLRSADELNVTDYILKPFDFIKFINLVGELEI
jgi:YesN/AraC family two-component response regulator